MRIYICIFNTPPPPPPPEVLGDGIVIRAVETLNNTAFCNTIVLPALRGKEFIMTNYNEMMVNEYGIGIDDVVAETVVTEVVDNRTLAEKVAASIRTQATYRFQAIEKVYNQNVAWMNGRWDISTCVSSSEREEMETVIKERMKHYNKSRQEVIGFEFEAIDASTRRKYAERVANTLPLDDFERRLFIALRMEKAWEYTTVIGVLEVASVLREVFDVSYYSSADWSAYRISLSSIAKALKRGLTISQLKHMLKEIKYIESRYFGVNKGICMSTKPYTYGSGVQLGAWASKVLDGLSKAHIKNFWRFARVFQYTKFISPKLSTRQLKKLDRLSNKELKLTVTDHRNWSTPNIYGNIAFKIIVIVRTANDWQPIRKNHRTDREWLTMAGRIPANKEVYNLPVEVIRSFNKKAFGKFIKELIELDLKGEHNVLSLAKIHTCLGAGWKAYFGPKQAGDYFLVGTKEDIVANVHDIGINLPPTMGDDQRRFFKNNIQNYDQVCLVVRSWELLLKEGVNPLAKEGLKKAVAFLASLVYEGCEDIQFAQECAKWGLSQSQFEKVQKEWTGRDIKYESIPKVSISDGDFKFYKLDRDDVRGPFLGEYTGCCQHPQGAGASCAIHGTTNPDGGFVVLEYRGVVKFQSWVWRNQDTLVFDNIEGSITETLYGSAKNMYIDGIEAFRGKLGIKTLLVGTGGSDIKLGISDEVRPMNVTPPLGYSDAHRVWRL